MPIAFRFAARSDVGLTRRNNEDSGYAGPHLLAMADGMGGHAGGEVASSVVVGALVHLDDDALGAAEAGTALLAAIHDANAELGERVTRERRLKGMGTTLIALLRARDKIVLAHIGDSRAFLVRDGAVEQITKDHSYVQTLVDEGRITAEEASSHPQRSLVTRVLTGTRDDEPDLVVRQGRAGDRYLIASDGLTDYVARDTIDEVLLADPDNPERTAERLVELALRAGAPDNVTVVLGDVIDITRDEPPSNQPVVVGAAALRHTGTRPLPTTPAAKAAALTAEATGIPEPGTDEPITLAEEGDTRRRRIARLLGGLLAVAIVLGGAGYAAWSWVQRQYYVGVHNDHVTIYRGVNQQFGPLVLNNVVIETTIPLDDLPDMPYRQTLTEGTVADSREKADELVAALSVQATACRWARANGEACQQVPSTWTQPTPTPSASPSASPSPSPSASPSPSPAPTRSP